MRERLATGLDRLRALARDGGEPDETLEADRAYRHLTDEQLLKIRHYVRGEAQRALQTAGSE